MRLCDCPFRILDPKLDGTVCVTCHQVIAPMNEVDTRILAYETARRKQEMDADRVRWQAGGRRP